MPARATLVTAAARERSCPLLLPVQVHHAQLTLISRSSLGASSRCWMRPRASLCLTSFCQQVRLQWWCRWTCAHSFRPHRPASEPPHQFLMSSMCTRLAQRSASTSFSSQSPECRAAAWWQPAATAQVRKSRVCRRCNFHYQLGASPLACVLMRACCCLAGEGVRHAVRTSSGAAFSRGEDEVVKGASV
jgi:hypothetical protein